MSQEYEDITESPELSIVVPVYKEEDSIRPFLDRMEKVIESMNTSYEILFCLDPSPDKTEEVILNEIARNKHIKLTVFSRRFGQPAATMAGIYSCTGKACIVIDVDLQDPPEIIPKLYEKMKEGFHVVCAKRKSRKGETLPKRVIAKVGYFLINRMTEIQIPEDTGDFRLITRRVINELKRLYESHGFLRGLVSYVGFRTTYIEYDRDERKHGRGKYNRFTGSLKIGLNGVVSFSSRPLQFMSVVGAIVALFSFLLGGWYVYQRLAGYNITPGIPTTVLVVTFFAGVQLLSLGLMGEYVGRIYDEVKHRPMYIIDRKYNL